MIKLISRSGDLFIVDLRQLRFVLVSLFAAVAPLLLVPMVAGSATVFLQTNFLLHLGALQPKLSRVSPSAGFKRIFGPSGLIEMLKTIGKLGVLGLLMWLLARKDWPGLMTLPWQSPHGLLVALRPPVLHLFIAGVATQGVFAAVDVLLVRLRHVRDLRMSKQDVRDELKDTEGNVQVKTRLRRIQLMRSRQRMMAKVPTATVVITNPTHYAIALVYDRAANPAPRIVAKGVDAMAARIRQIASDNRVPLVSNPPLARALYRLDLDTEIPAEHYRAVAEVIGYVWRLRRTDRAVS